MVSNAFAGDYFKYNSQGKLILPEASIDYTTLDSDDRSRLDSIIDDEPLKGAIGEDTVDKFRSDSYWYNGTFGWKEKYKSDVQNNLANIIGKINSLQNDPNNAALFSSSKIDSDYNFGDNIEPEGTPEFCSAYPQVTKEQSAKYFAGDQRIESGLAYEGCFGQEPISVPVKDLVNDFADISNYMIREQENKARENIMSLVASSMLDQRKNYKGIYENYPEYPDYLKRCFRRKSAQYPAFKEITAQIDADEKSSEMQSRSLIADNFDNLNAPLALLAKSHIDKRNQLRSRHETLSRTTGNAGAACRNKSGAARTSCLDGIRSRQAARENEAKAVKAELAKEEAKLQLIMNESPSLFTIENMGGYWSGAEMRIQPSDYMNSITRVDGADEITRMLSSSISEKMGSSTYLEARSKAFDEFNESHADKMQSFLDKVKSDSNVKESGNDAVYNQISKLDESLAAICDNEGESLHQYTEMFPAILNQAANSATSKDGAIKNVKDVQAGLCSLYRKDPPDRNKEPSLAKKVIGYTLIGGGVLFGIATIWTGVGTAAGMGVAAAGATMALGGSGVFAEHAYSNMQDAQVRENNGQAMLSTSWGDVRRMIEAQEDRVNARNEALTEVAFAAPDLIGLGMLARSARLARIAGKGGEALTNLPVPVGPHGSGGAAVALSNADEASAALRVVDTVEESGSALRLSAPAEEAGGLRLTSRVESPSVIEAVGDAEDIVVASADTLKALPAPSEVITPVKALPAPSVADDVIENLPAVADDVIDTLPAVRQTGTEIEPKVFGPGDANYELLPRDTDLVKVSPRPALESPVIEGTLVDEALQLTSTKALPRAETLKALPAPVAAAEDVIKALPAPSVADDAVKALPAPERFKALPAPSDVDDAIKALPAPSTADDVSSIKLTSSGSGSGNPTAVGGQSGKVTRGTEVIEQADASNTGRATATNRAATEITTQAESIDDFIARSHPSFKIGEAKDIPDDIIGKRISWRSLTGKLESGVVQSVDGGSLNIAGRQGALKLDSINGSSISLFDDGRRLSSAADFPDNMMGEFISFFDANGKLIDGIKRGQLIQRNKDAIVIRVPKDPSIPSSLFNPLDPSTFTEVTVPLSKIHGDSVAHVSYGNANGLRRNASADDFINLEGKRISFTSPYGASVNSEVFVVGVNPNKNGVVVRRAKPGQVLDPQNPATYKQETFYFSSNRINGDSIAVTERVVEETTSTALATIDSGVRGGSNLPAVRQGTELVPVSEGSNLPARKVYGPGDANYEILPRENPIVPSQTRVALEGPIIEGEIVEEAVQIASTKALPAPVAKTGTELVPVADNLPVPVAKTGTELVPVTDNLPVIAARVSDDVSTTAVSVSDDVAGEISPRILKEGDEGYEILDPVRTTGTDIEVRPSKGITLEGTATEVAPRSGFFSSTWSRLGRYIPDWNLRPSEIFGSFRRGISRLWRTPADESLLRRGTRAALHAGDDAAELALALDGAEDAAPQDTVVLEEETNSGPEVPADPPADQPDDEQDPFSSDRDPNDDDDDDNDNSPMQPMIAPAPRGNPVQPQFIKGITPSIQVKTGTY